MIGRRTALKRFPSLPAGSWRTGKFTYPITHSGCILAGVGPTEQLREKAVIAGMTLLLRAMGVETLIFMSDTSVPWRFWEDKAPRGTTRTMDSFKSMGVSKKFSGGFSVPISETSSFLGHTFRLSKTNAVSGDIHFIDDREQVLGHPCKYGNFHFYCISSAASDMFTECLQKTELVVIPQC